MQFEGQKFELGKIVGTPGAINLVGAEGIYYLTRHARGDWGDIDGHDKNVNTLALINGGRLLSSYNVGKDRLWIVTEADRSATTLLLPNEY